MWENSVLYRNRELSVFWKYKKFTYFVIWLVIICVTNIAIENANFQKLNLQPEINTIFLF